MTFPLKKRVNTELLTDRTEALYIGETQIRVGTYECDSQVSTSWGKSVPQLGCYIKVWEKKDQAITLSWRISRTGAYDELAHIANRPWQIDCGESAYGEMT